MCVNCLILTVTGIASESRWNCTREPLGAAAYVEVDAVLNPPPRPPSFAIRRRRLAESRRTLGIFEVQSQQEVRRLHCSACTRNHEAITVLSSSHPIITDVTAPYTR